jgi:hypothetical protein
MPVPPDALAVEPADPGVAVVDPDVAPGVVPGDAAALSGDELPGAGVPVAVRPLLDGAPAAPYDAEPLEPIVAFDNSHRPLLIADALPLVPAVPDVPVAPLVEAPLRCRQPVTVTTLFWPPIDVPLVVCDPVCAANDAAQPSAMANVEPVHILFMWPPHQHLSAMRNCMGGCNRQAT